jgi:hypothetical protein
MTTLINKTSFIEKMLDDDRSVDLFKMTTFSIEVNFLLLSIFFTETELEKKTPMRMWPLMFQPL